MFCALSGEAVEDAVITPSGHIYERRVLEKYLDSHDGRDPHTGDHLSMEATITVQNETLVKPRPIQATSIPGILGLLQSEWDNVMLENFELRKQLQSARQELTDTLYQHDAACRVIARLLKERDEALAQLTAIGADQGNAVQTPASSAGTSTSSSSMVDDDDSNGQNSKDARVEGAPGVMTDAIKRAMTNLGKMLAKKRKSRTLPSELCDAESIGKWRAKELEAPHSASPAGVLAIATHREQEGMMVSGGADHTAVVWELGQAKSPLGVLTGHQGRVTQAVFHSTQDVVLTGSEDQSARVWRPTPKSQKGYSCCVQLSAHSAPLSGLTLHPSNDYVATSSTDGTWALFDISTGSCLSQRSRGGRRPSALHCAQFHPDGLLMGTGGSDKVVRLWDVKASDSADAAQLKQHKATVTSLAFSDNGYYLVTGSRDKNVMLWDLRTQKVLSSLNLPGHITALTLDQTGSYVAAASPSALHIATVSGNKSLDTVKSFDLDATPSCLAWGNNASWLVGGALDKSILYQFH